MSLIAASTTSHHPLSPGTAPIRVLAAIHAIYPQRFPVNIGSPSSRFLAHRALTNPQPSPVSIQSCVLVTAWASGSIPILLLWLRQIAASAKFFAWDPVMQDCGIFETRTSLIAERLQHPSGQCPNKQTRMRRQVIGQHGRFGHILFRQRDLPESPG